MVEFERLKETAERLIKRLNEGGLRALDEALNATGKTAATYRYTYDRYIQYFKDKSLQEDLTEQDLYVGFAMAYSWMATIKQLDPRIDTIQTAVSALNRLRSLTPSDVEIETSTNERISPEQAAEIGMGGIVASALEASAIRSIVGDDMAVVTPGIRPAGSDHGDQKRVMTPADALKAGASHLVVARPIVAASNPSEAALAITEEMASV